MFERIVVGFDGSPDSDGALDWAAEHAGSARLLIVHIERDRESGSEYLSATSERTGHRVELIEAAERVRAAHPSLQVDTATEIGPVVDVLRSYLGRGTLVVVGRDGERSGRWSAGVRLAGSHTGGAVAVVPTGAGAGAGATRTTAGAGLGVVAGVDGSLPGEEVVSVAADLAEAKGETLTLVHAWLAPSMWEAELESYEGEFAEYEQMHRDTLAAVVEGAEEYEVTPQAKLVHGRPADVLLDAAEQASAVVVGSHSGSAVARFLLGSVSHELLLRAKVPVLVVLPD
ncbi:universal stress protein [Agromyces protaetiae]|uniref:Universal stress protein n=1 Tax=Agromyces protaetiae TaxID=2509455 RepID=A0A4P6F9J5_9MICO|nr:universal stress protein [Agromyces protaetiae]QAY72572.1 universal stress protein [Agromyces protaetiae]